MNLFYMYDSSGPCLNEILRRFLLFTLIDRWFVKMHFGPSFHSFLFSLKNESLQNLNKYNLNKNICIFEDLLE
ncbi:hypothetical protein CHH60_28210 [Paenibacillus sp. 7523-1]|nr:hypothetical protein CHH60_28210 [Paenibacillus sp. 7523-1]